MPICTFYETNKPLCIDLRNQLNGIIQQYVDAHRVSKFDEELASKYGIKLFDSKKLPDFYYCNGHTLFVMKRYSETAVDNIVYALVDAQNGEVISEHEHASIYHKDMFIITYFDTDAILC